jgi:hypothetical protein
MDMIVDVVEKDTTTLISPQRIFIWDEPWSAGMKIATRKKLMEPGKRNNVDYVSSLSKRSEKKNTG